MNEQRLQELFDFDEDDLAANRKGHLSEKQLHRMDLDRKPKPGLEWGIGLVLFGIAGLGIFAALAAMFNHSNLVGRIIFMMIFGVLWPYLFIKLGLILIDSTRPKRNMRVKVERGRLQFRKRTGRDIIPYFELCVGDRTIEVESDLSDIVAEGDLYAMYFLEKTKGLLSLERISKAK